VSATEDLARAVRGAAEGVGRSVVRVGGQWRGGSGFVIGDGLVLTNAHNVRAERLSITFADGRQAEAGVRGVDVDGDLAVLEVDTGDLPAAEWADATAELGSAVLGVALAGSGGPRVTVGFVSSVQRAFRGPRGRRVAGAVEHTAPLAAGSSGGPLVDAAGRVVGINTNRVGDGFYLALPADAALRERIEALSRGQTVTRPRLGVAITPAPAARRLRRAVGLPERDGLLVRAVEEGSPAEAAGIAEGDLIVAAGGRALADADDLYEVLGALGGRTTLELRIERGAEERAVSVNVDGQASAEGGPVH